MAGSPFTSAPGAKVISIGHLQAAPLARVLDEERREAEQTQATPLINNLAQHVRKGWSVARDAKRNTVETRMLQSIRARRNEYDPDRRAMIMEMGGSDVYAPLTSVKCRAAASWLRDVMLANGTEKPWAIAPTPVPDLPPDIAETIVQQVVQPMMDAVEAGVPMTDEDVKDLLGQLRDRTLTSIREQAVRMCERMEAKMEDQLVEGGFIHALNQFIDDIVTYPAAIIKGPVVRNKNLLTWAQTATGFEPIVKKQVRLEWERVSPFNIYPSPESEGINDGYLIEKHRLSRSDLNDLIGVEGYDDASIRMVLDLYSRGGLRDWLYDEVGQAAAEGKSSTQLLQNPDELIDALQFWGSVPGSLLLEWGLEADEIEEPTREYNCEIWVIGPNVIKATINYHPLGEKPYYKTSYEEIPGSFWGHSPCDLIRDAQTVVNAASRSLVNNMALASGPQVVVNVDRLAIGEDVTQLKPWRIWQVTSDQVTTGSQLPPVAFSQPDSNIPELASTIKMYMELADEWSGIPKYLTGDAPGGAGRTASGLSMLMSNAGKSLKQVVANVDNYVMRPMLVRLHFWNMRYGEDKDLKGDINVVVRGANALVAREAAQVRRNEFLASTANPIDMAITGIQGRAQVLREVAKNLDLNTDKIVPPDDVLAQKQKQLDGALMQQAAEQQGKGQGTPAAGPTPAGQTLMDGSPTVDNFGPPAA